MRRGDDLNRTLRTAASANGWTFVRDVRDTFRGHGYCADADHTWFRSLSGSKKLQGDEHGTAHPNRAGHAAMASLAGPAVRASRPAPEPVQIVVQLRRVRIDDPPEKPGVPGVHPLTLPQPRRVFFSVIGYAGTSVPAGAAEQMPLGTWVEPGASATFETMTVGSSIGVKGWITLPSLRVSDDNAPKGFVDTGTRTLAFERFYRRADGWGVPSSDGRHYGAVQHLLVHGNGTATLQVDYRIGVEPLR